MKRTYKFTIILILVILLMMAVIVRAFMRGTEQQESSVSTLPAASIPTVTMTYKEQSLNCIQGYAQQRDRNALDTVLTPVESSGNIMILINSSSDGTDRDIEAVNYTIYREADKEIVENRRTEEIREEENGKSAVLNLSGSVSEEEQYLLEMGLEDKDGNISYYYTRVIQDSGIEADEFLAFAKEFSNNTFNKKANDKISIYIEPDNTGNNTTLQQVNIHSSYDQITWGELNPRVCGDPVPDLLVIDGENAIISMDYQVQVQEDEETNSYYLIHEYYRLRKSAYRVHLLEFEREMTQTFLAARPAFTGQTVNLGILPEDIEYVYSEKGDIVCWEQAGELWQFFSDGSRLYKIFSLQDTNREDKRSFMQDYDIHILNMDKDGNVDFVVCGYFNRGAYEGKTGLLLCHYAQNANSYEVRYVLEDPRQADILCQEVEKLTYLNGMDFYFYKEGAIWHVDLSTGKIDELIADLDMDALAASEDGRSIAWVDDLDQADRIHRMDLKTGEKTEIRGEVTEYLRPIGFIGKDFACGKAKMNQVVRSAAGELWFPMYSVLIFNEKNEKIKEYANEQLLVTGGYTTDEMINLERVTQAPGGTGYVAAQSHQIVSSGEKEEPVVTLTATEDKKKQTQQGLKVSNGFGTSAIRLYTAEENNYVETISLEHSEEKRANDYYVYVKGRLAARFRLSRDAVVYAEKNSGMIKDNDQSILYYKAGKDKKYEREQPPEIDFSFLQTVKEGASDGIVSQWQDQVHDGRVLDATGITFDMVLNLVQQEKTVLIQTGTGAYRVVMGFTEDTVDLYDPISAQPLQLGRAQADAAYQQFGTVCIVCL